MSNEQDHYPWAHKKILECSLNLSLKNLSKDVTHQPIASLMLVTHRVAVLNTYLIIH